MSDNIDTLRNRLEEVRANPHAMIRIVLDELEEATEGKGRIPNPTNPVVFAIESAVTLSSIGMIQAETLTRKVYPSLAQTEDDLYRHMSDVDYLNRFSSPSRTTFTLLIGIDELYQKAVQVPNSRMRKLTIPRHSVFQVSNYSFTMQYPIELRIMAHNGLQVVYDVSKPSPIQTLETNVVDWRAINLNGVNYVRLDIPLQQLVITPHYAKLNNTSGFTQSFSFNDQYYFCRAYMSTTNGGWQEIRTTHTDQVFDPYVPTVLLKVTDGVLQTHIPPIYFTTGLVDREIRFDIYTTSGPLELMLSNYNINSFLATWRDIESDDNGVYSAPLTSFAAISVFSTSVVTGGSNGLTFEQLRERTINGTLSVKDAPTTKIQLASRLEDLGYRLVTSVDNITDRIFQATRPLPQPSDLSTITGIGCRIGSVIRSMDDLILLDTVTNNGNRITILPTTLFEDENGIILPAANGTADYINSLPSEALVTNVNGHNYLYTPFHYVLDINDSRFDVRPYYLDNPSIDSRAFVEENDTALLEIATRSFSIERTDDGFDITVVTESGESYRNLTDYQVQAQMSYIPVGENNRAFLNGELVGVDPDTGERVFVFHLTTNYDVNRNDQLILTSFKTIDAETQRNFATNLLTTFDLVYGVIDYTVQGLEVSDLDDYIAPYLLPEEYENLVGIIREQLTVRLGYNLSGLWSKSRSILSSIEYETYETDVPLLYEQNIYEMDPNTNSIKITNNGGTLTYVILHHQGDPVLDELDQPVLKYLKGDIRLDNSGNPIIKNPRGMLRELNLFLLDGKYYFATDSVTIDYRDSVPMNVVEWLRNDITPLSKKLHEKTELFYYPQATLGNIDAIIDGAQSILLPAEQSLRCQVFVTQQVYGNIELRASLEQTIAQVVAEHLARSSFSMKDLYATLDVALGDDVLGIRIEGLGGGLDINTLTMKDDSQRAVIRKGLTVLSDGKLRVRDDIAIDWTVHLPR